MVSCWLVLKSQLHLPKIFVNRGMAWAYPFGLSGVMQIRHPCQDCARNELSTWSPCFVIFLLTWCFKLSPISLLLACARVLQVAADMHWLQEKFCCCRSVIANQGGHAPVAGEEWCCKGFPFAVVPEVFLQLVRVRCVSYKHQEGSWLVHNLCKMRQTCTNCKRDVAAGVVLQGLLVCCRARSISAAGASPPCFAPAPRKL